MHITEYNIELYESYSLNTYQIVYLGNNKHKLL